MTIEEYIKFRLNHLNKVLEATSGIQENDNIEDLRIVAQISELTELKKNIDNGKISISGLSERSPVSRF